MSGNFSRRSLDSGKVLGPHKTGEWGSRVLHRSQRLGLDRGLPAGATAEGGARSQNNDDIKRQTPGLCRAPH